MGSRWDRSTVARGAAYDERFERLARAGHDVHGEASFVMAYEPSTVLDAGCGTGRVAIELRRRGVSVVGVDLDRAMLETACEKEPDIEWFCGDLATLGLPDPDDPAAIRRFDVVLMAGNVMIFVEPGTEATVVERMADHLVDGGRLVCGFQLTAGRYTVDEYDAACAAAGLVLEQRYSSWSYDPWDLDDGYAVSVHVLPALGETPDPGEDAEPSADQAG